MPGTRPGMTEEIDPANRFSDIQRLVATEDAVLIERDRLSLAAWSSIHDTRRLSKLPYPSIG